MDSPPPHPYLLTAEGGFLLECGGGQSKSLHRVMDCQIESRRIRCNRRRVAVSTRPFPFAVFGAPAPRPSSYQSPYHFFLGSLLFLKKTAKQEKQRRDENTTITPPLIRLSNGSRCRFECGLFVFVSKAPNARGLQRPDDFAFCFNGSMWMYQVDKVGRTLDDMCGSFTRPWVLACPLASGYDMAQWPTCAWPHADQDWVWILAKSQGAPRARG